MPSTTALDKSSLKFSEKILLDQSEFEDETRSVTELKEFLGCTQQMSQYCRYYGIVASPLHRLTRVTEPFPKQWLPGTDYDIAFHRIKSMMLDKSLFL